MFPIFNNEKQEYGPGVIYYFHIYAALLNLAVMTPAQEAQRFYNPSKTKQDLLMAMVTAMLQKTEEVVVLI